MSLAHLESVLSRSQATARQLSGRDHREPRQLQKSVSDFAELAVGPVYRNTVAEWILDRNMFVRAFRNSVAIGAGAIARKMAMQRIKFSRRIFKKSGMTLEPVSPFHPLCQLFENVNPMNTEWELWYYTEAWKMLTGNAYWWKGRNLFGVPKELWMIPSQWVRAIPSRTAYIGAYEIRNLFRTQHPVILPGVEIIQLGEPNVDWNANGRFYGAPVVFQCANTTDIEQTIFDRLRSSFLNYAEPGQVFSTDKPLTEPQLRQIYNQIVNQHTATEHTGRPMITHSGLKPQNQRTAVKEMDYKDSLDFTMTMTLAIFGTPKAVVGLVADANRANMEAAMLAFCENCINPRLESNSQHLTRTIVREFEPDGSVVAYFDRCTVDDADGLRRAIETGEKGAALDPNEIRELLFKKPPFKHGGNRPFLPSAVVTAPWGNDDVNNPEQGTSPGAGAPAPQGQAPAPTPQPGPQPQPGVTAPLPDRHGTNGLKSGFLAPNAGDANYSGNGDDPQNRPGGQKASGGLLFRNPTAGSAANQTTRQRRLFRKATEDSVAELIRDWEQAHTRHQGEFSKSMLAALQEQKREAISRYKLFAGIQKRDTTVREDADESHLPVNRLFGRTELRKAVDPEAAWNMLPVGKSERLLANAADDQIMSAALFGANLELRHIRRIAKSEEELPTSKIVRGFMNLPGDIIGRIRLALVDVFDQDYWKNAVTDPTREMLKKTLLKSIREGWTPHETYSFLERDPDHTFDRVRAERIVRTETTAAIGGGQWAAQENLIARNLIDGRIWMAILDAVTRKDHYDADQQKVVKQGGIWVVMQGDEQIGDGQEFIIGDERARFPGDPKLSAQQRVHCRCVATSFVEEPATLAVA